MQGVADQARLPSLTAPGKLWHRRATDGPQERLIVLFLILLLFRVAVLVFPLRDFGAVFGLVLLLLPLVLLLLLLGVIAINSLARFEAVLIHLLLVLVLLALNFVIRPRLPLLPFLL